MNQEKALDGPLVKFEEVVARVSKWFEWIAMGAALVMMFTTFVDVLLAKLFTAPIPGSIDVVMLFQLVAIAFVAPLAQLLGRHVQVEFVTMRLGKRAQAVVRCFVNFLLFLFFILVVWQLFELGESVRAGHEVSPSAGIALYPFAYGASLALLFVCLATLLECLKSGLEAIRG